MSVKYKWLSGRLKEMILHYIETGRNKLPTEAEISGRYKVSRQTVRQALALLEQEGLIVKKRGSGSYITGLTSDPAGNTIAILISDDSDYIYPGLLYDIQNTLSENGFAAKVFVTHNRFYDEREILLQLLEQPPRGIIAEGCKSALPAPNLDLWYKLAGRGRPILFLHNYYPELENPLYLKDDNLAGSNLLVQYLVKQGHTDIGAIFKSDDMQGPERFQGFMEAMQELGLPVPDEQVSWFDSNDLNRLNRYQDRLFLKKAVQESLNSCTAVLCYNDMIAYALAGELKAAGYDLPADMELAAFDHTYLSGSQLLAFPSISHEPHEMGKKAAQMMISKLKGLAVTPQELSWTLRPNSSY